MSKTLEKPLVRAARLLLALVLALGLSPMLSLGFQTSCAFATEPPEDNENLFWIDDGYIWGYTLNGMLEASSVTGVPEEYGYSFYNEAWAVDVILSDVDDDDTITVALQSTEFDSEEIDYYMESGYGLISATGSSYEDVGDFEEIKADAADRYSESEDAFLFETELVDGEAHLVAFIYLDEYVDEDITGLPIIVNLYTEEAYNNQIKLVDVVPTYGQLENTNALFGLKTAANQYLIGSFATYLIVPYGMDSVEATLTFNDSDIDVSVNGIEQDSISAEGNTLTVTLNAAPRPFSGPSEDSKNVIHLSKDGIERDYTIWAVNQRFDDLPDRVVDFLSVNSQYTNDRSAGGDYGTRAIRSLVGSNYDAGGNASGPVSLGNYGGYIIYEYDDPIMDDPSNPYGIDFITYGNSVEGSNEFGEVGQVWVSEDGENWYALAGGMHYEDYADWDYKITYTKQSDGSAAWTDNRGKSSVGGELFYPLSEYYPWHTFADGEEETLTLSGIYFPEDTTDGGGKAPFAGFGYTDMGQRGTTLDEETGEWGRTYAGGPVSEEGYEQYARNIAANPYLPTQVDPQSGRKFSYGTDGMDLAWAVDADGQPVSFPNGVHFVKIVTATNIVNSAFGEKSTEVNMVRVARANDSAVGKTAAPAKITVDGVDIALEDGTFVYDGVAVDGDFQVAVDVLEGTNVYINNNRAASVDYEKIPDHGIVRVIVQEGEKEPAIYILNLVEGKINHAPALAEGVEAEAAATVAAGESWVADLTGIFADPDGDELAYKVTDDKGLTLDIPAKYGFAYVEPGTYTLVFVANDGELDSPAYTVTLTVVPIKTDGTPYHIVSKSNPNYVLDVAKAMPEAGSNVSIWTANGGANQLFTFEQTDKGDYVIRNVANPELVLDAAGERPDEGANVSTWTYNGGKNQEWSLVSTRDGNYIIVNVGNPTLWLDAAGDEPQAGANVSLWPGTGADNQMWAFVAANDLAGATVEATGMVRNIVREGVDYAPDVTVALNGIELVEGADYELFYDDGQAETTAVPTEPGLYVVTARAVDGGKYVGEAKVGIFDLSDVSDAVVAGLDYRIASASDPAFILDVAKAEPEAGSNVSIWTSNGGANQLFTIGVTSDGYYVLNNVANIRLVLDAAGAQPKAGANVSTWTYNDGMNQKWVIVPDRNVPGYYTIRSAANPEYVLDAVGSAPEIGANVDLWTYNGGANQLWSFARDTDLAYAEVAASGLARNATDGALSPDIAVTLNGHELAEGTDYVVMINGSADRPSAPGSYEVTIEAAGIYKGAARFRGLFTIYPAPVAQGSADAFHLASGFSDEFVLDVAEVAPVSGANVSIWVDNGGANQLFTLELQDSGFYVLRNVANPELVLDAAGEEPQAGANVSTWAYHEALNQQWVLVPSADEPGYYMIQSVANPEVVLDAAGAAPEIGANVSTWTANGGLNQLWKPVAAEAAAASEAAAIG